MTRTITTTLDAPSAGGAGERANNLCTPIVKRNLTRHLAQAILDCRALLAHIDTLIRERDSYRALRERIEQGETP